MPAAATVTALVEKLGDPQKEAFLVELNRQAGRYLIQFESIGTYLMVNNAIPAFSLVMDQKYSPALELKIDDLLPFLSKHYISSFSIRRSFLAILTRDKTG